MTHVATSVPHEGPLPDSLQTELRALLGTRFSLAKSVRHHHGADISALDPAPPDAVAFAESIEEIARIASACHSHDVPMIVYGAGTSLEGWLHAVHGGVCIDVSAMNRIIDIRVADMDATVQPGVTRKQLNAALHGTGLFFPIDPGADASLGGMAATRASGTNAVRYGTMRENVLGMTAVLADGRVIRTGTRARKSSAGYDLTRLFVGSEGTLGVVTEITLRLYPLPEAVSAAVCAFPSMETAVRAVIE